jgi:hypothetical protein
MPEPPGVGVGDAVAVGVAVCVVVTFVLGAGVAVLAACARLATRPEEAVVISADTSGVEPLKVLAELTFQII